MDKQTYMTVKFVDADASLITTIGDAMEIVQEQVRNLENGNGCEELSLKPIQLTEEKFREIEALQKELIEQEQEML